MRNKLCGYVCLYYRELVVDSFGSDLKVCFSFVFAFCSL